MWTLQCRKFSCITSSLPRSSSLQLAPVAPAESPSAPGYMAGRGGESGARICRGGGHVVVGANLQQPECSRSQFLLWGDPWLVSPPVDDASAEYPADRGPSRLRLHYSVIRHRVTSARPVRGLRCQTGNQRSSRVNEMKPGNLRQCHSRCSGHHAFPRPKLRSRIAVLQP